METLWLSWSRLRSHTECKQKGYLQRAKKQAILRDVRGYFPGTVTDRVVRDWLAGDPENNPKAMPAMVESILLREEENTKTEGGKLIWKDSGDKDFVIRECVEAVTKIEPLLDKYVLPFNYSVDWRFKVPMKVPHPNGGTGTIMLNGAQDILVWDVENRYAVWDVKHTRNNAYYKKTRGQLSFYDLAVKLIFGADTSFVGLLQPLCDKPDPKFVLTEEDRDVLLQSILGMANDVWKEEFPLTEDVSQCFYCDVKHACPKFTATHEGTSKKFSLL